MSSRLEELFLKLRTPPGKLTMDEAKELQQLARADRHTVGQKTARAKTKAGKPLKTLSLEAVKEMLLQQGTPIPTTEEIGNENTGS